jgi:phospholipase C
LPYDFDISDTVSQADGTVQLKMVNAGGAGAVFHVFDLLALASNPADFDPAIEVQPSNPKKYTIEAGKELRDVWHTTNTSGKYHLSLHGPNGFVRQFAGDTSSDPADLTASFTFNPNEGSVWAILTGDICNFTIVDNAYGAEPFYSEYPTEKTMSLKDSSNWYDLSVTAGCAPSFSRRIMGRMETGSDSISDPAMAVTPAHNEFHPPMPEAFRHISNRKPAMTCRASFEFGVQHKDMCWGVESEEQMVI